VINKKKEKEKTKNKKQKNQTKMIYISKKLRRLSVTNNELEKRRLHFPRYATMTSDSRKCKELSFGNNISHANIKFVDTSLNNRVY